jgi:PiT family inorganic phosphate transporter
MTFLHIINALVLTFDFINGFHDSANSIATVVSTKGFSAVKWGVTTKIFRAWILTIPISGLMGTLMYFLLTFIMK